jgi:DNA mismatch endonuclease (patch repair protein)
MKRVRQRKTAPEDDLARLLRKLGLRYRRNAKSLPGSPDFSNRRRHWALFVNGCFWHHHRGCVRATVPTRNRPFWKAKFDANRARDAKKIAALRRLGFRVLVVWECQLAEASSVEHRLKRALAE